MRFHAFAQGAQWRRKMILKGGIIVIVKATPSLLAHHSLVAACYDCNTAEHTGGAYLHVAKILPCPPSVKILQHSMCYNHSMSICRNAKML
jgi:hypothetical protein